MTLRQLAAEPSTLPTRTTWYLLARLQKEKKIKSLGTGRGAKWEKTGN